LLVRSVAVLLAVVGATGCSTSTSAVTQSATRTAENAPPTLAAACGSASQIVARSLWLTTSDRVRLYAVEAGAGSVGVVLAHQGRSDLCEELPYAKTLVDAGLHVLAFDFRGNGHSARPSKNWLAYRRDFAAAIELLRTRGATRVFLIGASMGGAAAVQNGAGLPLAGVVSLSGTRLWPGYGINRPGPRLLRDPLLYIGGKSDWRAPVKEARAVVGNAGSRDKRRIFYAGSMHGWELVQDAPFAPRVRAVILAWVHNHSLA
jgi:pimeloyl-ACP methyl ester carboxylesterase